MFQNTFMAGLDSQNVHRAVVEHLVRQLVYTKLGKTLPRQAAGTDPLVVNVVVATDMVTKFDDVHQELLCHQLKTI